MTTAAPRKERKKFPLAVTPVATAAFCYTDRPDDDGQFADNKYKVTLVFEPGFDRAQLDKAIAEAVMLEWQRQSLDGIRMPYIDGDTKKNEEFHGKILLVAKSKYQPGVVDAQRQELDASANPIYSGDKIRCSLVAIPYENSGEEPVVENGQAKMKDGKVVMARVTTRGVTFQLRNVQIMSKGERKRPPPANDFGTGPTAAPKQGAGVVKREIVKPAQDFSAAPPATAEDDGPVF